MTSRIPPITEREHALALQHFALALRNGTHGTAALLGAPETPASTWYTADTAPCGRNQFVRAAKRGEFRSFRVGKKLLAKVVDVDAWIERHEVTPDAGAAPANDLDDVDAALAAGNLSVRGGR